MARMTQPTAPETLLRPETIGSRSGGLEPVAAKILVVDDDRRNLFAVEEMLRAPGVELVLATSGEAALRHVLTDEFAVILLDVQMPGLDGYEVASLIRARPRSSRVPILFLTAFNKDELHVFRGYTAGAVDYVFKPIEPLVLRSKVDVFVDLYRKTEEIRRQGAEERRLLVENLRVRGEKLQAEQALRRRDEQQSLVLRSLPIALYTASLEDDHRRLHFTNESIERITGIGPEAFMSEDRFWESRVHPDDRERVLGELKTLGETGSVTLEYRWRCADDTERYFYDQAVLIRDDDGRPREIFGLWFDISERKQLEQNLLHASKLEAVGRLTGGIAHDFNNMLSVVIGNLDLLRKSVEQDKKASRRLRFAMDGAQRCADLTNRLLAFSRRQPLQATVVDLKVVMPDLSELLRRTLGERITIKVAAAEDVWPVHVDRSQFESALLNLCVNARDAMPDGGRLLVEVANRPVGAEPAQPGGIEGDCVIVSVTDTGTGMPPAVLERVFEPFFTTKESGKGTGLGLSMVYGFVQQSGGHIEIDSEPGKGTTIRMFLPRSLAGGAMTRPSDADGPLPVLGRGETVLIVEDDPNVRQVTVSTLESLGFAVKEAGSGDEAAAMLRDDSAVQVILSDVKMPGMTGIELGRLVRQQWPAIGVLLTSGYVDEHDAVEDFDFIHKPFRASELAHKLETMLKAKPAVEERHVAAAE
jgi:PAS domain S-box-containing protein